MILSQKRISILLWTLWILFVGRVVGQLWVYLDAPVFLPSMPYWYSGLMPYRFLLPSQILTIVVFAKIAFDITMGTGFFGNPKPRLGQWLRNFGTIYFVGMIIRFILQGISIMVVFHWVLAAFILLVGVYHLRRQN